jgi:membrane-associated protease RseP (regulator of RpoE activity)
VSIRDVTAEDVATLKLTGQSGAFIDEVTADSPAAKAGTLKGDVVVSFDGENVRSAQQFTRLVRETPPGRTVKMAVTRGGKRMDLNVTPNDARSDAVGVWMDDTGARMEIEREMERLRPELDELRERRFRPMPHAPMMPPPNTGTFEWHGNEHGDRVFAFATGKGRLGVTVQDLTPELAEFFAEGWGAGVERRQGHACGEGRDQSGRRHHGGRRRDGRILERIG